jgi:type I restriction enzyme S subunit
MGDLNTIPKNWKRVKLGEYVISVKGKKPKRVSSVKTKEFSIPYVNIKAFEKNKIDEYTDGIGCVVCEEGDFLMVWDGSRSGYVGKAIKGALGSTLVKLNFPDINNNYAYYFLQSKYIEINTRAKGVGIPHVDPNLLWNYDLLIPDKETQQAIVSKIEELFSKLETGKKQLEIAQQQLKIYRQSVLKWAFEGKLTGKNSKQGDLPKDWKWVKLGEVSQVSGGLTKNSKRQKLELQLPFLRVANVYFNFLDLNEIHTIGISENEIERVRLKAHDLLFVEGNGSIEQIGRVALWDGSIENCVHQNHLIKSRLSKQIVPKYALYFFCSKLGRDGIKEQANSTSGLHTLSLGKISKLELPLSPIAEQHNIVEAIENRLSVADKMEENIGHCLQQTEALRISVLKKAFEGQLLSQSKIIAIQSSVIMPRTEKSRANTLSVIDEEFPKTKPGITVNDLHAGILALIIDAHEKTPVHLSKLNHVKGEKIAHLVEYRLGISLGREPVKDAAGPDDYNHLKKVEHRANKAGFFRMQNLPIGRTYKSMRGMQKHIVKIKTILTRKEYSDVNNLIQTFLPFEMEHAEVIATLYAGWNNLLLSGKMPTDEEIVYESRENWSSRKLTIDREKFFKTLGWMKKHDFIPEGRGKMVLKKEEKQPLNKKKK